jgi:soluble lytic murein transglycosylase
LTDKAAAAKRAAPKFFAARYLAAAAVLALVIGAPSIIYHHHKPDALALRATAPETPESAPAPAEQAAAPLDPGVSPSRPTPLDASAAIAAITGGGVQLDPPAVSAYAATPATLDANAANNGAAPVAPIDPAVRLGLDLTGLREGLAAYAANQLQLGDQAAATARSADVSTALEFAAIKQAPQSVSWRRIAKFIAAHPDWPTRDQLKKSAENALLAGAPTPAEVAAYFEKDPPISAPGKLALARAAEARGDTATAQKLVRELWRGDVLSGWLETQIQQKFAQYLRPEDSKARAERLFYKEQVASGLRAATLAGKDAQALAAIRVAAINETGSEKIFAGAPPALASEPSFIFSKIQYLRRSGKLSEAVALMNAAPRSLDKIVDGDEWWTERRVLARKLLAAGDAANAYKVVAGHAAQSNDLQVEAEFHCGWIALRFLNDAPTAIRHFDTAIAIARTPISRARANYWRGRAAEAAGESAASQFYARAAEESATFYGQVARLRLGRADIALRRPRVAAEGAERAEAIRVIEALYAAGAKNLAAPLAIAAAKSLNAPEQMAALAKVVVQDRDAKVALNVGKLAAQRGFAMDDLAFPTYGVPQFAPFANSAPIEVVYAIARQESAFDPKAVSHAGAMGLMQMIASTARRTAERVGVPFEAGRMTADPIFNAQLGAAHLGDLLVEQRNSLILTFAAYNAGGKRVREWIAANGDPRNANVDPIDWIEMIPIAETRNYVQRVMENLGVYRARLGLDRQGTAAVEPLKREARL